MLTTIIFVFLGLVVIGLGLLVPSNYNVIGPKERGFTLFLGKVTSLRGSGITITWPWENLVIRPTNQQIEVIDVQKLTTGSPDPMEFGIALRVAFHVEDVVKSVFGFRGDFKTAFENLARGAIQESMVRIGGNALLENKLPDVLTEATRRIAKNVTEVWGIGIDELIVADIDLPQVLIDATAIRQRSQAEADALTNLSIAEVNAYERELKAQGRNYRFHQLMDTMQKMAATGAFQAVGSMEGLLGKLLIQNGKRRQI